MVKGQLQRVLGGIRRALGGDRHEDSDGGLLARFVRQRDEAAFEVLLRRHGPMVLGVCRRLLRDQHLAEDVFQATFLVLVRKAGSLRQRERVGGWLHGVAYRLALKARAAAARQQSRRQELTDLAAPHTTDEVEWRDLRVVLDREIAALPAKYREPIILSYLQGKTNSEVARELGCPEGTVFGRLARARQRLRTRLVRRGVTLGAAGLEVFREQDALSAALPPALAEATVKAAGPASAAALPASVAGLVKGALRDMVLRRIRVALVVVLLVGLGTVFAHHLSQGEPRGGGGGADGQGPAPQTAPGAEKLPAGALALIGARQFRFVRDSIAQIAYSPDGTLLAAAGYDNQLDTAVVVWDARTGRQLRLIVRESMCRKKGQPGSADRVTALALSPDRKTLAWAADWPEPVICLYDLGTGKELHALKGARGPLAFAPGGKYLAAVGGAGTVRLWSVATGKEEKSLAGSAAPLAFSGDGKLLATGGKDYQAHVWETASGKELRALDVGMGKSRLACFFDSSFTFASSRPLLALRWGAQSALRRGAPGTFFDRVTLQVWDVAAGRKLLNLEEGGAHSVGFPGDFLAFAPDGRTLYSRGIGARTVRALEAATGKERLKVEELIHGLALAPDGKSLASWEGRVIHLWETATGKERMRLDGGHGDRVLQLAIPADGKTVVSASWDRTVGVWDLATGKPIYRFRPQHGTAISFELALGGKAVVGRCQNGFHMWDILTGKELHSGEDRPLAAAGWAQYFEVSPDGRTLGWSVGGKVRLADLKTGKELPGFPDGVPRGLTFSPEGKLLAQLKEHGFGTGRCKVYLRDLATHKDRHSLPEDGLLQFARVRFLGGGKTLATDDVSGIRFWDVAGGKETGRIVGRRWSSFSPDGKLVVTGTGKGLTVQETATGKEHFRLEAPLGWATPTLFSPDGRLLAVAGEDGAVRVLEVSTGKERRTLRGHQGRVRSLAFSPDGKILATGGDDTTIVLWDLKKP